MNTMDIIILFNICSIFYRDIFARVLTFVMLMFNIYFLVYFTKTSKRRYLLVMFILILFCIALGSVNLNNLLHNNYNNILQNLTKNVFYFFRK